MNSKTSTDFTQFYPDRLILSSQDLGWSDLDLRTFQRLPNAFECPALVDHLVVIHKQTQLTITETVEDQVYHGQITPQTTLTILPAGLTSQWFWPEHSEEEVIHLYLRPGWLRRLAIDLDIDPDGLEILPILATESPQIHHIGLALEAEVRLGGRSGDLFRDSLSTALGISLLQNYSTRSIQLPTPTGQLSPQRLQQVFDYIHAHLDHPLTLEQVATQIGLSRYHFARSFKRTTGQTLHHYVTQQRVNRAVDLIQKGTVSLTEIAAQTGFSSHSHMTHYIRQIYGVTPTQIRQQHRSDT